MNNYGYNRGGQIGAKEPIVAPPRFLVALGSQYDSDLDWLLGDLPGQRM